MKLNTFQDNIITFPKNFQKYFEEGKFTLDDLKTRMDKFIDKYEQVSGAKSLNYYIHLDESVIHLHWFSTNFDISSCETLKFKTYGEQKHGEWLQDLGAEFFNGLGGFKIRRGNSKKLTGTEHVEARTWAKEQEENAKLVEKIIGDGTADIKTVDELIGLTEKPLQTALRYIKRSLVSEELSAKREKNERLAVEKFNKSIKGKEVTSSVEIVDYLIELLKKKDRNKLLAPGLDHDN